jgi:hypothetical protein
MLIIALKQLFTLHFWQEVVRHILLIFTFGFWKALFQFLFSFRFILTLFIFLVVTLQTPESSSSSNWLTKTISNSERLGTFLTTRRLIFLTSVVSIILFLGSIFYVPRLTLTPSPALSGKEPSITYQQSKSPRPTGLWEQGAEAEQGSARPTSEKKSPENRERRGG